jgi:hypothetical protein
LSDVKNYIQGDKVAGEAFTDRYGLWHDKQVINGEPSSNNPVYYTALHKALGGKVDDTRLAWYFNEVQVPEYIDLVYFIRRIPTKKTPPISRDEIIGWISLGFNPLKYGWFLYRQKTPVKPLQYLKAAYSLFMIRDEHRNYFWEREKSETYCIALKLWWHDRYYINIMQGNPNNIFYWLMFNLYAFHTIFISDNISAKNVCWLQLKDMGSKFWIRFINRKKNFQKYFGEHPFNEEKNTR